MNKTGILDVLKVIALSTMLIDHLGFLFEWEGVRHLGRLAFPLFAYCIVQKLPLSSNRTLYIARIFCLGLISQLPFYLLFGNSGPLLNICFTLALGIALPALPTVVIFGALGVLGWFYSLPPVFDFGFFGVAYVASLRVSMAPGFALLPVANLFGGVVLAKSGFLAHVLTFAIDRKGFQLERIEVPQVFSYAFYPVHLAVLAFTKCLL